MITIRVRYAYDYTYYVRIYVHLFDTYLHIHLYSICSDIFCVGQTRQHMHVVIVNIACILFSTYLSKQHEIVGWASIFVLIVFQK